MQEVFEECAIRVVESEPYFLSVLDELEDRKRKKLTRKFTKTDAESIFKIIEEQDPFTGDNNGDEKEKS